MKAIDVLKKEQELTFPSFDNEDAYLVGNMIVEKIKKEKLKNVRIRVVLHDEIVFQYLMNGKKGDLWLNRKQKTIETLKHSGHYLYLENEETGKYKDYENDETMVLCGGSFPVVVGDEMIGCVIVSGLASNEDHQLIVDVLTDYKKKLSYAFASDIDGTLYFPGNGYKDGDLKEIEKFQKAGGYFGICSGRPLSNIDELKQFNFDFYIVTSGAILLDKDLNMIEDHPISKEIARDVFDEYKDRAGIIIQTGSREKIYGTFDENGHMTLIDSFDDVENEAIYGISLIVDKDEIAMAMNKELAQKYKELEGFQNRNSIDIAKKGCSKGIAVQRMKELLNVDKIAGIGDSYNDMTMIDDSDIGFTFHDSPQSIKEKADYVVESVEEAIDFIMK